MSGSGIKGVSAGKGNGNLERSKNKEARVNLPAGRQGSKKKDEDI